MKQTYLLVKKTYGDFDIPQFHILAASQNEHVIDLAVEARNQKRTPSELRDEVSYVKQAVITL